MNLRVSYTPVLWDTLSSNKLHCYRGSSLIWLQNEVDQRIGVELGQLPRHPSMAARQVCTHVGSSLDNDHLKSRQHITEIIEYLNNIRFHSCCMIFLTVLYFIYLWGILYYFVRYVYTCWASVYDLRSCYRYQRQVYLICSMRCMSSWFLEGGNE